MSRTVSVRTILKKSTKRKRFIFHTLLYFFQVIVLFLSHEFMRESAGSIYFCLSLLLITEVVTAPLFWCFSRHRLSRSFYKWLFPDPPVDDRNPNQIRRDNTRPLYNSNIRARFRDTALPSQRLHSNVPHKKSCMMRSQADAFMRHIIRDAGHVVHCWPASTRDEGCESTNILDAPSVKDFSRDPSDTGSVDDNAWMKVCDKDSQQDLPTILGYCRPTLILSFQPRYAGYSCDEYSYYFNEDSSVTCVMQGNDTYTHHVYDYNVPHFTVPFGEDGEVVHYQIESRDTADINWKLLMLIPISVERDLPSDQYTELAFRTFVQGANVVVPHNNDYCSYGTVGDTSSVLIPNRVLRLCRSRYRTFAKKESVTPAMFERMLTHAWKECADPAGASVSIYNIIVDDIEIVNPCPDNFTYAPLNPYVLEVIKPSMRAIGTPLIAGSGFAPAAGYNSELDCVTERVINVRNQTTHYPKEFAPWVNEFVDAVVPPALRGVGCPLEQEEVEELQNKPNQRAAVERDRWSLWYLVMRVSSFMKREAYAKIAPSRNISTVPSKHKLGLSAYSECFTSDVLKPQPWYAFGLDPAQLRDRVCALARRSEYVVDCDYSRYDGTLGGIHAMVCRRVMLTWCHSSYRHDLEAFLDDECSPEGKRVEASTKHGVKYEIGTSRLSGSPITSSWNSLANAFEKYCALRHSGLSSGDAFESLGLYGGDDSLDSHLVTQKSLQWVTRHTGLQIKYNRNLPGSAVPFLGRLYYDPWTLSCSHIDLRRQVAKLHLTTAEAHVSREEVVLRRALSIIATDLTTPFIGPWAVAAVRLFSQVKTRTRGFDGDAGYYYHLWADQPEVWTNEDTVDPALIVAHAKLDPHLVSVAETCFSSASKFEDLFPELSLDEVPIVSHVPVIIGDEIIRPASVNALLPCDLKFCFTDTAVLRTDNNDDSAQRILDILADCHASFFNPNINNLGEKIEPDEEFEELVPLADLALGLDSCKLHIQRSRYVQPNALQPFTVSLASKPRVSKQKREELKTKKPRVKVPTTPKPRGVAVKQKVVKPKRPSNKTAKQTLAGALPAKETHVTTNK